MGHGSSCRIYETAADFYCECEPDGNYAGELCDVPKADRSVCTPMDGQCQNGGVCVLATDQQDGTKANYCKCPLGFSGERCHGTNVCPLECQHDSSCRHDAVGFQNPAGFYCECAPGSNYVGDLCEIPSTLCPKRQESDPPLACLYGGKCTMDLDEQTLLSIQRVYCTCPAGRSGDVCQIGTISTIQDYNGSCRDDTDCQNGGLCVHKHDADTTAQTGMDTKFTYCHCKAGFGGETCEQKCDSLGCQHGSSCRFHTVDNVDSASAKDPSTEPGAYCDCDNTGLKGNGLNDGKFKGLECEIEVERCPPSPLSPTWECLYGGTCVGSEDDAGHDNLWSCSCPKHREGKQCEILVTTTTMEETAKEVITNGGESNSNSNSNTGTEHAVMNMNDVVATMQGLPSAVETDVIIGGILVGFFSILAIVLGLVMRKRRKRQTQSRENQLAVANAEELDDAYFTNETTTTTTTTTTSTSSTTNGDGEEEDAHVGNKNDGDGDIVNVDLNDTDEELPNQNAQIV